MAPSSKESECLGDRAWPCSYRSYLVVLRFLASPVSERCPRVQPKANRHVCLAAVCCSRSWELYRRLISGYCIRRGVSVVRARTWVCAVSCLPILAGIPAARVHNAVRGAGPDLCGLVGLRKLVHDGTDFTFGPFPSRYSCHGYRTQWVSSGTCRRGVHLHRRDNGGSVFLWAGIPWSAGLMPLAATASLFLFIRPQKS